MSIVTLYEFGTMSVDAKSRMVNRIIEDMHDQIDYYTRNGEEYVDGFALLQDFESFAESTQSREIARLVGNFRWLLIENGLIPDTRGVA